MVNLLKNPLILIKIYRDEDFPTRIIDLNQLLIKRRDAVKFSQRNVK